MSLSSTGDKFLLLSIIRSCLIPLMLMIAVASKILLNVRTVLL